MPAANRPKHLARNEGLAEANLGENSDLFHHCKKVAAMLECCQIQASPPEQETGDTGDRRQHLILSPLQIHK
jgi:hypothetical protein